MLWSALDTQEILAILPVVKNLKFDGVEIPILRPGTLNIPLLRDALEASGLACTVSTALSRSLALIDEATRAATVRWLADVISEATELHASIVCGPLLAPIGEMRGRGCTSKEWNSSVYGLKELGKVASAYRVDLALEPLNRFETFVINTVADGVKLVEEVGEPSVGLLLDTFHMNIEEKSVPKAIQGASEYIKHFHCSENDRGIVGSGQVPWEDIFSQLSNVGYKGWLVVESFGTVIPEIAAAASIWRPLAPSADELAAKSLNFISERSIGVASPGPR